MELYSHLKDQSLTDKEKRIFREAFKLGFSKSFDGWNGETFSESNGILYQERMFNTLMETELKYYAQEQTELHRAFNLFVDPIDLL